MSPLLVLSVIFCAGILTASYTGLHFLPVAIIAVFVTGIAWFCSGIRHLADASLCLLSFLLGCCCIASWMFPSASEIGSIKPYGRVAVIGVVAENPDCRGAKTRIVLIAERIIRGGWERNCHGRLLVFLKGNSACELGDRIIVTGEFLPCAAKFAFGKQGYVQYLANHGISRVVNCQPWEIVMLQKRAAGKAQRALNALKNRFITVLRTRLSPQSSAMMQAMILGEKTDVSPLIQRAMINSGTIHILVVSGFNVGIVAFMLLILFKLLRIHRKARFFFLLPCIIFYCLLTGACEPVVRAALMAVVMAVAYIGNRDGDIQNAFALAMCTMLFINPRFLFDASFQLSFVSVFALIVVFPVLQRLLHIEAVKNIFLRFICEGLLVSFSAWLATAGFVAYYFKIVTPGSVITNIFAAPLAGFITLCGFSLIIADTLFPWCARFIAITADYSICLMVHIVSFKFLVFSLP